jgi:hypothetical protein
MRTDITGSLQVERGEAIRLSAMRKIDTVFRFRANIEQELPVVLLTGSPR